MMKATVMGGAVMLALGATFAAGAQQSDTQGVTATSPHSVSTTTAEQTKAMERLTEAAQRLRETIQALAKAPVGPQRDGAMESARQALRETQQAMIDLPPELRARSVPMSEAEYARAMDRLQDAAQRLRDSAHAMATQLGGQRRNEAIDRVNTALREVNQAMVQLPWQVAAQSARTGATGGTSAAGKTGGGMAGARFDDLDRNHDGVLSRSEFAGQ
ncbi:MAG TPA: hypothetical protein VNT02_07725 [Burkholderiales bacterium]|nr:hypothetical protein [Burkholderiales bacterium]